MKSSANKKSYAVNRHDDEVALALYNKVCEKLSGKNVDLATIADNANVAVTTLYLWVKGDVLLPYTRTLFRVAGAVGIRITATHIKGFKVPQRLRLVK